MRFSTLFFTAAAVLPAVLAIATPVLPTPANPGKPATLEKVDTSKGAPALGLDKLTKVHAGQGKIIFVYNDSQFWDAEFTNLFSLTLFAPTFPPLFPLSPMCTVQERQQLEEDPSNEGAYFTPSRGFMRERDEHEIIINQEFDSVLLDGIFSHEADDVDNIEHLSLADILSAKKTKKLQLEKDILARNAESLASPPMPRPLKQASRSQIVARLRNGKRLGAKPSPSAHYRY